MTHDHLSEKAIFNIARQLDSDEARQQYLEQVCHDDPALLERVQILLDAYRFRKFARKNKALLATSALVSAALVLGLIGTSWQAYRATRAEQLALDNEQQALAEQDEKEFARREALASAEQARQAAQREAEQRRIAEAAAETERLAKEAEAQQRAVAEAAADAEAAHRLLAETAEKKAIEEAAIAKAVSEFLQQDLLGLAGAEAQLAAEMEPDPHLKLATLLDRALIKVEERFSNQPAVRAAVQSTLAGLCLSPSRFWN